MARSSQIVFVRSFDPSSVGINLFRRRTHLRNLKPLLQVFVCGQRPKDLVITWVLLLLVIYIFSIWTTVNEMNCSMTGFEPSPTGIGSNHYFNRATTLLLSFFSFWSKTMSHSFVKLFQLKENFVVWRFYFLQKKTNFWRTVSATKMK